MDEKAVEKEITREDIYEGCGFYLCDKLSTSLPPIPKGVTLFKKYLEEIGFPEGNGLSLNYGEKPKLYTIDKQSGNKNTEVKIDAAEKGVTLVIGVRDGENWEIYEVSISSLDQLKKRNVISLGNIQTMLKDGKARKLNNRRDE